MRLPRAETASISISLMRSLLNYQQHITRSYNFIKYDRTRGRLSRDERDQIEFNIIVAANGSVYNADVRKALTAFIRAAADKMESRHLTILGVAVVLILATGYFGRDTFKAYVASQAASRDLAAQGREVVRLSEQETARAKILGSLASEHEQARSALVQVELGYQPLLRAAASSDNSKILGVDVPQSIAKELTTNPRREGEGSRVDGAYEVVDFKRHDMGVFSVILKPTTSDDLITAEARAMFLPDDQIDLLLSSVKTGRQLHIMVNAWQRHGRIISAEIVRVDPQTTP